MRKSAYSIGEDGAYSETHRRSSTSTLDEDERSAYWNFVKNW